MGLTSISTSPANYVVLDVETNGLKSKEDDLLSVSIYKPDDGKTYDRFFPLDLNRDVYTTEINGITKRDLKGRSHLVQADVDELFSTFELDPRTILRYGGLDERFIRDYFARHNLAGYERMHFFTPPYETVESLRARLGGMYGKTEVGNVKSIAWFVCRKESDGR